MDSDRDDHLDDVASDAVAMRSNCSRCYITHDTKCETEMQSAKNLRSLPKTLDLPETQTKKHLESFRRRFVFDKCLKI